MLLAGQETPIKIPYVGMFHIFYDSVESFQAGSVPSAQGLMVDIPNYTDLNRTG